MKIAIIKLEFPLPNQWQNCSFTSSWTSNLYRRTCAHFTLISVHPLTDGNSLNIHHCRGHLNRTMQYKWFWQIPCHGTTQIQMIFYKIQLTMCTVRFSWWATIWLTDDVVSGDWLWLAVIKDSMPPRSVSTYVGLADTVVSQTRLLLTHWFRLINYRDQYNRFEQLQVTSKKLHTNQKTAGTYNTNLSG